MMTREEAIKILSSESYIGNSKLDDAIEYAIEALSEPTKTEPTRTKAKWIEIVKEHKCYGRDDTYTTTEYQCSACGAKPLAKYASDEAGDAFSAFCPNCGAEVESEQI